MISITSVSAIARRYTNPAGRKRMGKIEKPPIAPLRLYACREIDRFPRPEYNQHRCLGHCRCPGGTTNGFVALWGRISPAFWQDSAQMDFAGMATQELTVSGGSFDTKERVKQAVDIVDLVGSHIQLRRQGRNYVGLCPWHDDTRPSLQVNPERQSFKCWVCDIGGDVFSFVMKIEGVEFREALQMLADRAGIRSKSRAADNFRRQAKPQAVCG